MKLNLTILASALLLSLSANAVSPDKVDFSKIQMNDLQVVEVKNGQNLMGAYKFKPLIDPTPALIATLENASYSRIISPIYELNQKSSFKNIYYYIAATPDKTFEFVVVYHTSSDSMFAVDMNITNVETDHIDAEHGPTYEIHPYKITSGLGMLFPI
jgi:hypothetical protein